MQAKIRNYCGEPWVSIAIKWTAKPPNEWVATIRGRHPRYVLDREFWRTIGRRLSKDRSRGTLIKAIPLADVPAEGLIIEVQSCDNERYGWETRSYWRLMPDGGLEPLTPERVYEEAARMTPERLHPVPGFLTKLLRRLWR